MDYIGWIWQKWLFVVQNQNVQFACMSDCQLMVFSVNLLSHNVVLSLLFRIITGGFDKTVKIWSVDGKLIHRLEGFLNTISGVCYVPRNKTVWVASGNSNAQLYDPKSGDNVSRIVVPPQKTILDFVFKCPWELDCLLYAIGRYVYHFVDPFP